MQHQQGCCARGRRASWLFSFRLVRLQHLDEQEEWGLLPAIWRDRTELISWHHMPSLRIKKSVS